MLFAIIIALIIGLVIIAIVANSMQQQKQKEEAERRQQMTKFKAIIDETEEVLINDSGVAISKEGFDILHQRVLTALRGMNELQANQKDIVARIQSTQEKINAADYNVINAESLQLPENEKALVAMLQGIKKYRTVLRSEHGKGRISSQVFMAEDKKVEKLQLKINVDTQLKRGKMALDRGMTGSARQYFEKAQSTLDGQSYVDEYITNRKLELKELLDRITQELASANAKAVQKKADEENNDLDELFAPKKKW